MSRSIHEWIVRESVSDKLAKRLNYPEVVRCKDCKYWGRDDPDGDGCECSCNGGWWLPDDYCSCGERRDTDEDNTP